MSERNDQHLEPGYRPVLIREDLKLDLQGFRRRLPNKDMNQERRLITAAVMLVLKRPDLHQEWLSLVPEVVSKDVVSRQQAGIVVPAI